MNSNRQTDAFSEPARQYYRARLDQCESRIEGFQRQSAWMSRLRGMTFFPAAGLAIYGGTGAANPWLWYAAAAILFVAFIVICTIHENVLRREVEAQHRRSMSRIQLARLDRRWNDVPVPQVDVPEKHKPVSRDLDLFGHSSVFQMLSVAHTPWGRETLRDWLLEPAEKDEIARRQEAVVVLAANSSFREDLDLRGRQLGAGETGPEAFVRWAEGPRWLAHRAWLKWLTRALSVAALVVVLVAISGVIDPLAGWSAFLMIVLVNGIISLVFLGKVYEIFSNVSSRNHDIQHYRPLLEEIADLPQGCSFFDALKSKMGKTTHEPIVLLGGLMRIIRFANLRRDGLMGIPYFFSELIVLTDFHVLWFLERWQSKHGHVVRNWLQAVAELEAISSLATLAHDHPDWALPTVTDPQETTMRAKALGHPLLPDDVCVRNDVEVGPRGTFMLVTGSNMSGKSTLLRSIGVNVALAQAGGPVCAAEFCLPPLQLATSMRIADSLADGVSFFMAALKRLKQIVDQGSDQARLSERRLLYLLDEILQGTNSAERHIAVVQVISHLVEHGSIGAVSTHDLELARSPELSSACQTVHFRETIDEGAARKMTFDYKMRPGLAPTTNALKLLALVGLTDE